MRVQHNIPAMSSYRNYANNNKGINKNLEKLSSGYKINRAGDDAAGLAISEKMRAQITGLEGAQKNAKDGISLVQTAEGALTEVHSMLKRMVSLAEQSANGTYDSSLDRNQLQKEVNQLRTEIDRIADSSNFNGIPLLDGQQAIREAATVENASDLAKAIDLSGVGDFEFSVDTLTEADQKDVYQAMSGVSVNLSIAAKQDVTPSADKWSVTMTKGNESVTFKLSQTDGTKAAIALNDKYSLACEGGVFKIYTKAASKAVDANSTEIGAFGGAVAINSDLDTWTAGYVNTSDNKSTKAISAELDLFGKNDGLQLQIGDTSDSYNQMLVDIGSVKSYKLGLDGCNGQANSIATIDISTQAGATEAMDVIKAAINNVSDVRGTLGATQNRLEHTINNLSVMQENIQDAEGTIRDTDVADEMMAYTKNSILVQSAQAMLAQANQLPQGVLQLLQ